MLHKEFWGLLFLAFVVWVFTASTPSSRIENACRPIGWGGNVVVSLSALALPDQQTTVQGWFKKIEYGCQYTVWRLFFEDTYNQWKAKTLGAPVTTPAPVLPDSDPGVKPPVDPASGPKKEGA